MHGWIDLLLSILLIYQTLEANRWPALRARGTDGEKKKNRKASCDTDAEASKERQIMIPCKYCGKPFDPANDEQLFCCPKHKAAWHRENVPSGTIKNWRPLKDGTYSVTVRYEKLPKGIRIGGAAWLETGQSTRTEPAQDIEND